MGMQSCIKISKHFGASLHATVRRYVEQSSKKCALLVLENIAPRDTQPLCDVRNYFQSQIRRCYTQGIIRLGYTNL